MPLPTDLTADGFAALGLSAGLVRAAAAVGWARPTPIQRSAVPAILQGRDLLATAPTGSGKTAAFVLPLLQWLSALSGRPERALRALVLTPTRELALQTGAVVHALAPGLRAVVAVGGLSINPQLMALRGGADLVVATPGRLLDLLAHRALRLSTVELLVLDEADRLLDLGFADQLGPLLALLPPRRQTLMFSATMPAEVAALADRLLADPLRLEARPTGDDAAAAHIAQRAIVVDSGRRSALLRQLIADHGWTRVLVFVASQYASEQLAGKLQRAGHRAAALHGRLSPGRRHQVLVEFKLGTLSVLVATDLAARGIDVSGLSVVVNHDLPRSAVDYSHRVGRSGRADAPGQALSFILADAPGSEAHFRLIEKRQGRQLPRERLAGFEPVAALAVAAPGAPPPGSDPAGGIKGRRKSRKDKLREAAAVPGSRFTPTLPLHGQPVSPPAAAQAADAPAPTRSLRVMVVDDNRDAAESLAMLLTMDGHEVQVLHDGRSALDGLQTPPPEVFILDIGLPDIDGHELARRLRKTAGSSVFIALTGYGQSADRALSAAAGFDHHFVKPVDLDALSRVLAGVG